MPGLCRYDALATTLALLDGVVLTEPLEPCDGQQEYTPKLVRDDGDGFAHELHPNVCAGHNAVIALAQGYATSIKLRTSSTP